MTQGIRIYPTDMTRAELAEHINVNSAAFAEKFDKYVFVKATGKNLEEVSTLICAFLAGSSVRFTAEVVRHSNHMSAVRKTKGDNQGIWVIWNYGEEIGYLSPKGDKFICTDDQMQFTKQDLQDIINVMP